MLRLALEAGYRLVDTPRQADAKRVRSFQTFGGNMDRFTAIDPARQALAAFFEAARPVEAGYRNDVFSFVAVKHMDVFTLLQARLVRSTDQSASTETFQTDLVMAGRFRLGDLGISIDDFLKAALLGSVPTPTGDVRFPPGEAGRYQVAFEPFHQDGLLSQSRLGVLEIEGGAVGGYVDVPAIDWHLRAAPTPYHGLSDLLYSLELSSLRDQLNISVVAPATMLVDANSKVDDTTARVIARLAYGLPEASVQLGYRIVDQGRTVQRGSLSGTDIHWVDEPAYRVGRANIEVPSGAVVQCFATVCGVAQHFYWIVDPTTSQNPRRAAYQVFDPQLTVLRDFISRQGRGQPARDLEVGVSWLLWLLGFSVANLGGTAKTQDFADIIATTPTGHFVVVECTTGLLKADNKLPLLVQRTEALRQSIERSNHRHLKVLPVLVTSRSRQEVRADLDQAERLGILVLTADELRDAPDRALVQPDADQLFREAEHAVEEAVAKRGR